MEQWKQSLEPDGVPRVGKSPTFDAAVQKILSFLEEVRGHLYFALFDRETPGREPNLNLRKHSYRGSRHLGGAASARVRIPHRGKNAGQQALLKFDRPLAC